MGLMGSMITIAQSVPAAIEASNARLYLSFPFIHALFFIMWGLNENDKVKENEERKKEF